MRKLALLFVLPLALASLKSFGQESVTADNSLAMVSWENEVYDFGTIAQGTPVSYEFSFTNSGEQPLIITNVKASCGCTATNYPKEPVNPGESASITATYNAKSAGSFNKTLTVYTNTEDAVKVLRIKGVVQ